MAAGKHGASEITVTYDSAPGGTGQAVHNFIMELGGAEIVVHTTTSHAFGDAWNEHTPTGQRSSPPISVSGHWDDTATSGPHIVFNPVAGDADPNASTRTLVIVFGNARTFTVETRLIRYRVIGQNGDLTKFEAEIQPTGAAVWS
jgi:hypothetical protein